MRNLLIITFDLIREGEPETSLAIGYLMSCLKAHKGYGTVFTADHVSFNLFTNKEVTPDEVFETVARKFDLSKLYSVAIGCYVWADRFINPLIQALRNNGFRNKIILGGYQITTDRIRDVYPGADVFIAGYGEEALLESILADAEDYPIFISKKLNLANIPSPILSNVIHVKQGQGRVRIETKRGCINNCSFCAHKDLQGRKIYSHPIERVFDELFYLKDKSVGKINIIDPLFNCGDEYIKIMDYCSRISLRSVVTLQVSFDYIKGENGKRFLETCSSLNIRLEFGLQSIISEELAAINRVEDTEHIKRVMFDLRAYHIPYMVSLIYGLPLQTPDSFKSSIQFLLENGCREVHALPLMLLNGTQIWTEKDKWELKEDYFGYLHLPFVVSSESFDREDWNTMRSVAGALRRKLNSAISAERQIPLSSLSNGEASTERKQDENSKGEYGMRCHN